MEWPLSATVNNFKKEIADANYPNIRLFMVEKAVASHPKEDVVSNGWMECRPETVPNFSAVAYFFGRDLQKEIQVPIGLISSNWGGTPAESWTDLESVKKFPRYTAEADNLSKAKMMSTNYFRNTNKILPFGQKLPDKTEVIRKMEKAGQIRM